MKTMSLNTGKHQNGSTEDDDNKSSFVFIDIGLPTLDKLRVAIDDNTTAMDLKCKIEFLSGVPSDLFELYHDGTILNESLSPVIVKSKIQKEVVVQVQIMPVWERFVATCLKLENSQVRARIRVKMHGVTKDERIFVACYVAATQGNSCLLFGLLPSNKLITRTVRLSRRNILHAAVIGGNRNCVANILMNGGGKLINMKDVYGKTPMYTAKALNTGDIVDMLEAYEMVSLRGEGPVKVVTDDDSGYECVISSQSLDGSRDSTSDGDSEEEDEISSNEENETQAPLYEKDLHSVRGSNELLSASFTESRHSLEGNAGQGHGHDRATTTATTNEVDTSSEEQLLITEENNCTDKNRVDKQSADNFSEVQVVTEIPYCPKQTEEEKHVTSKINAFTRSKQSSKAGCVADAIKPESKTAEKDILTVSECISNNRAISSFIKKREKEPSWLSGSLSTNLNPKIDETRSKDISRITHKGLNNNSVKLMSDGSESLITKGSNTLNGKMIFKSGSRQKTAVLKGHEKPLEVNDTVNPLVGIQTGSTKPDVNLLPRRRKTGVPSLIVSKTSSGLGSSFERLNLLNSDRKELDSVPGDSSGVYLNASESSESQVCAPPIIKGPLIIQSPSSPIPVKKNTQHAGRKLSTGSPTSSSPKFYSRSDMQSYLDEVWRRASDSEVNESLSAPRTRPRSYSTPHPADPRELSETIAPSSMNEFPSSRESCTLSKSWTNTNTSPINTSNRRQSVGAWVGRNAVGKTFDEWVESKKEQHRRNSLAAWKENERRLSLENQQTNLKFPKHITHDQWLAMKALEPERKVFKESLTCFHGNERNPEESAKAFRTWLQKKDEEALEREQRLLDEAISRRSRDTKRENLFSPK